MRGIWGSSAAVLVAGSVGAGQSPPPPTSPVYERPERWICHADTVDFCDTGHDVTSVAADGTLTVGPWRPARRPAVDCFYLYPTTSHDQTTYSDYAWTMSDEGGATWAQAARWGSPCRVFAPVYRSFTLPGLFRKIPPPGSPLVIQSTAWLWGSEPPGRTARSGGRLVRPQGVRHRRDGRHRGRSASAGRRSTGTSRGRTRSSRCWPRRRTTSATP